MQQRSVQHHNYFGGKEKFPRHVYRDVVERKEFRKMWANPIQKFLVKFCWKFFDYDLLAVRYYVPNRHPIRIIK